MLDDPSQLDVASPIAKSQLRPLDPRCCTVQFAERLTESDHKKLSALLRKYPSVSLRIYGHYFQACDLSFLRHYPFVRHLEIDAYSLTDFAGMQFASGRLKSLRLSQTQGKRHSLQFLRRFRHLQSLQIENHTKDIEVIGELSQLRRLTLRSVTLPDLLIFKPLKRLRFLMLEFGGTNNLDLLPEIGQIQHLGLLQIRGLCDLQFLPHVKTLENLLLWNLINVNEFPSLTLLRSLRRVYLQTMKGLADLRPLARAPYLKELVAIQMGHLQPEAFRPFVGHRCLRNATVYMDSIRKNAAVAEILALPTTKDPYDLVRFFRS